MFFYRRKKTLKSECIPEIEDIDYDTDKIKTNSIYVFGDFTVYDNKGFNASHLFSPKVKHLLLYILFKSIENKKGVDSHEIYLAIWPDKSTENAKNLKGVAINQIRKILADINGIELNFKNNYFSVNIDDQLYFDYFQAKILINESTINQKKDELFRNIAKITSRGLFLQSTKNCNLVSLKHPISTKIKDELFPEIAQLYNDHNFTDAIRVVKILNSFDNTDENLLKYEIKSYLKMNKTEGARKCYLNFISCLQEEQKGLYVMSFTEYTQTDLFKS